MLLLHSQLAPLRGPASVKTSELPTGATKSSRSLDEVAQAMDDARLAAQSQRVYDAALAEALEGPAAALNRAADDLEAARVRAEEMLCADAVELAVEIARQITKVRFHAGEYALEQIVRSTLAASDIRRGRCVVRVHPADEEMMRKIKFRDETTFELDGSLVRGAVHVETPRGLLVRDPNAALEEIREQLLEELVE